MAKIKRLFSKDGIKLIKNSSFYKNLKTIFKNPVITNEVNGAEPEIVWRLVRPNSPNDVGPLHADKWFWLANKWNIPKNKKCVKVWIMLGGETTKSGLRVVPSSQKNDHWDYRIEKKHGIQKPVFDENNKNIKALLVPTKPGNAIIFSYDLLHGGVQTIGNHCRVSLEFTIFSEVL